ncbi:MAG: hypothetical protein L6R39_003496 [Caloplaca ligustica]|nr:MAG: hypothetical protein L6R39_003496 [Caloplaca ligustica]
MDNTSAAYQGQLAHWDDDREPKFVAVSVFLIVATCLAIAVRFWAQRKIKKQWALDNIVIFFAASAYTVGVLQGPCLGLIKVSILLFYRRMFTMHRRAFEVAFYILGTYTLLLTIATLVVFILQCLPITFFWDRAYFLEKVRPPHVVKGHCLAQQLHVVTTLLANTVSDVAILVLPAVGLWNLQLPTGKKVGLFGVFSLGAL